MWANCTWSEKPQKQEQNPNNGGSCYRPDKQNQMMPKACKWYEDYKYAIILLNGCKNNTNRIQERGKFVNHLQRLGGSENTLSWLVSLLEMAKKQLRCLSSPETTSNLDFDPTLFPYFCKFCSASRIAQIKQNFFTLTLLRTSFQKHFITLLRTKVRVKSKF